MEFIYIVLLSAAITGGIVYIIPRLTKGRKREPKKSIIDELELEIDEDFLEDVDSGFEGRIYKKVDDSPLDVRPKSTRKISSYPECFGTVEIYNTCKRDCAVLDECTSTIKMLEGL